MCFQGRCNKVKAKRVRRSAFLLLAFCIFLILYIPIAYLPHQIKNGTYSFVKRRSNMEELDVFDFMLNPDTSRRDNFGALFRKALQNNNKISGNFLEIGGGSGKFFYHNMKNFGDIITRYVLIEPYASEEFTQVIQKWMLEVERSPRITTNITVIHDFSTANAVITSFPDNYFDFVYIDGDHSYEGSKSDLKNYYPKVKRGGVISGHDYCCNYKESKEIVHAPWCGRYIYPHSTSTKSKDGKEKASWCGIYKGAEEFAKENNFYWFYTLEGRQGEDNAGFDNPSYFTFKQI